MAKAELKSGDKFAHSSGRMVTVVKVTPKTVTVEVERAIIDRNGERKTDKRERSMPRSRFPLFISPYNPT